MLFFSKTSLKSSCSAPQPASPAAAVSGVTYTANIMFPSECPGKDKQLPTQKNWLVANIFHTAVNISLRAKNAVGDSHTEIHIPAESSSDLAGKACASVRAIVSAQFSDRSGDPKNISFLSLQLARTHL